MRAIVFSLGFVALPLAALSAPARAEPADALCVYLGFACSTPAPQVPTLLPGPLYLPAAPRLDGTDAPGCTYGPADPRYQAYLAGAKTCPSRRHPR